MARALRVEYEGAIYHVMNRGNRFGEIYADNGDREQFLEELGWVAGKLGWSVHAFVLMGNHYHLLIETHQATLVRGMQQLNGAYTQAYNRRHRQRGHLFQGRYKALLVDGQSGDYLRTVADYIHLNPVRAGMAQTVRELLASRWNSAGWLAGRHGKLPEWLEWRRVYGAMNRLERDAAARREFAGRLEGLMARQAGQEPEYRHVRRGWVYGAESFVERLREKVVSLTGGNRRPERWKGAAVAEGAEEAAARMLRVGLERLGAKDPHGLTSRQRGVLAAWIRHGSGVRHAWLRQALGFRTESGLRSVIAHTALKRGKSLPTPVRKIWKILQC